MSTREQSIRAVIADYLSRRATGESVSDKDVSAEHPDLMPELGHELAKLIATATTGDTETIGPQTNVPDHELRDLVPGYSIARKLSEGGQGVVYLAIQKSMQRRVAIKMMKEGVFASRSDRARFDREGKVLARLNHPNIVTIHDSGTTTAGHYLVMDYISGRPLDEYMKSADAPGSVDGTMQLFEKICSAVNAAHLAGIIHRDLKPSNILVDGAGEPHILDFGLAKVPLSDSETSMMTMTGQFIGSLPWASPEQAEGLSDKIDMRTDVYSLGIILYQILTGRFPYEVTGPMRDVLERIMRVEPRRPSALGRKINDEVDTIALKCLSKERERRYQSAGELARDVQHYLSGRPIEAKHDSLGYLMRKQLTRHRVPVAVAVGFVAVILVALVTALTLWRRAESEGANARFRLKAARTEAARSFDEYQVIIPRLRRAEDLAALLPREIQQRYPLDAPPTTYREATEWITGLFPTTPDSVPATDHTTLNTRTRDAVESCARHPELPRDPVAVAWVHANQDGVNRLVEVTEQHRFDFGTSTGDDLLVRMLIPSLRDVRFGANLLTASAVVHHDEGNSEMAIENLHAAMRISRYVGDGATMMNTLAEIACRKVIYNAYRWMLIDAVASGTLPPSYVAFMRQTPPPPDYEHAYITEVRWARQMLNETFVRTSDQSPARLDLTLLRNLSDEVEIEENQYADPSEAMIENADTLDYEEAISAVTELCDRLRSQQNASFREIRTEGDRVMKHFQDNYPALHPMMPDFTRALEILREAQMSRNATAIAVAIAIYRHSNGAWPESLDDALASFELEPSDRSYYGHDFEYRIVDDSPLLYAVGPNEIDDNGQVDDVLFLNE